MLAKNFLVRWILILLSARIVLVRTSIVLSSWISDICNTDSGVFSFRSPRIFIVLCIFDYLPLINYCFHQSISFC